MGNSEGLVMEKIEALTPEQIAKLPEHIDKWVKIGLSTETPSREIQKASIVKAYQCAGRKAPSVFIWTESPLHAVFCCTFLQLDSHVWKNISKSVWESLRESVSESLRESLRESVSVSVWESFSGSVWDSVSVSVRDSVSGSVRESVSVSVSESLRESVWDSVSVSVWESFSGSVWDSVSVSVRDSVSVSVRDSVSGSVRNSFSLNLCQCVRGSHEARILSFYSFVHNELKIDCSQLDGLFECAKNCGWFIPFQDVVIVSPKPQRIKTITNSLGNHILHADGEPAIYYCDDFKIYMHQGVRIPEAMGSIPSKDWDPQWFVSEQNVEIKRIIAEALGYEKLFSALGAQRIDSWREYTLYRAENVDVEPLHILQMKCPSTGKLHYERTPPDILSARASATWGNWGLDPESFIKEC
jgi:hypothetical protein